MQESNPIPVQTGESRPAVEAAEDVGIQARACASLLETTLSAARLPAAAESSLRERFSGKVFEPAALKEAVAQTLSILQARGVAAQTAGEIAPGPIVIQGVPFAP